MAEHETHGAGNAIFDFFLGQPRKEYEIPSKNMPLPDVLAKKI